MRRAASILRLAAQRRATTTVEFGLVGSMMLLATFGTIDLGMLLWTQSAMQSTAAIAARCAAISSPACSADVPGYAATMGSGWTMPGVISASNVAVNYSPGTCNGVTGSLVQVTITASFWANVLPWPFHGQTLTASACYPKP
jgi:Flp pilus assembly protein TadG